MYNDLPLNRIGAAPVEDSDAHIQELINEIEALKSLTSPEAQELIRDLQRFAGARGFDSFPFMLFIHQTPLALY